MQLHNGDVIQARELTAVTGEVVPLPDPQVTVHLQFRRYAGCPICNLHLREFVTRHEELTNARIREVVAFHSTRDDLIKYQPELPFAIIADPRKQLYREFGVERSYFALAHPRTWLAAVRGWSPRLGLRSGPGGHFGLPADFLIATNGRAVAVEYGTNADGGWSVDHVLDLRESLSST